MNAVHATFPARFQPTVLSRCVTAVLLTALGTASHAALAPTPYPSLPQYSSTNVTPNILLFIDNSGSMGTKDIPLSGGGTGTRMDVAKTVAKDLINNNKTLNWGLASFNPNNATTAGVIRQAIKSRAVAADQTAIDNSINGLTAATWTPLAEAYYEMTRYWRGMNTFYWTGGTPGTSITPISPYTRPITLRCQKNFTIVLTDGEPTEDYTFPTSGQDSLKTGYPGNALNDFSKMMYTEDILNTTATDSEGVSFNDVNFLKQNLVTYTVGFGNTFLDQTQAPYKLLEKTALDAGGKVYSAQSQSELTAALTNAVNDINRQVSNGQEMAASPANGKSVVFKPTYNPKADGYDRWYGDVQMFTRLPGGVLTPVVGANARARMSTKAANASWWDTGRVVLSSLVVGDDASATVRRFAFRDTGIQSNTLTEQYWNVLGADDTARTKVVNFVRGKEGVSGLRSRNDGVTYSMLGDIIGSSSQIVAKPDGQALDTDYSSFVSANAGRSMLFIGANDGMLHGFYGGETAAGSVKPLDEVVAYVPSKSYYNLRTLTDPTYGNAVTSHPHTYFLNGPLQMADIRASTGVWRTYLTGGLGQGGQGLFTLDVTQMSQFSESAPGTTVKWEYTDRHDTSVGYQFQKPLMTTLRLNNSDTMVPVAIFTSGYDSKTADAAQQPARVDSDNKPALYVVNLLTGALVRKITLPSPYDKNLNMGAPAGGDVNWDGFLDVVYAGDDKGNLWRFDLTKDDASQWTAGAGPLFQTRTNTGVDMAQPIMYRPVIVPVFDKDADGNIDNTNPKGNMVVFGTGRFLYSSDKTDTSQQSLYGIYDSTGTTSLSTALNRDSLTLQTVYTNTSATVALDGSDGRVPGTYRTSTRNAVSLTDTGTSSGKGWRMDLPNSAERLVANPYLNEESGVVSFPVGSPVSSSQCAASGEGWVYGLDPETGYPKAGFIDVNKDTFFSSSDQLSFVTPASGSGGEGTISRYPSALKLNFFPGSLTRDYQEEQGSNIFPDAPASGGTASVASRESNNSGIFRLAKAGGAAGGATTGKSVPYSIPKGGSILVPCQGSTCVTEIPTGGKPPSTVSVERVTWRELIQ